jgi:hypothetical protein
MKSKHVRVSSGKSDAPSRRRRFRIERLEERIAPKKGGKGTNNCGGGTANCTDDGSGSIY